MHFLWKIIAWKVETGAEKVKSINGDPTKQMITEHGTLKIEKSFSKPSMKMTTIGVF